MNKIYITLFFLGFSCLFFACKQMSSDQKKDQVETEKKPVSYELVHKLRLPLESQSGKIPLLILMHGLGSNEADLYSLAEHLDKRLLIASVRAPYEIGPNKYSWYDFKLNGGDHIYSYDKLKSSRAQLLRFIDQLKQEYNIDAGKIYLGGFSQGAIMSLATALNHSDVIEGAIVLSGDLLGEVEQELKTKKLDKQLNIYMSHGRLDAVLPFAEAEKDLEYIKALGVDVENYWYDSKHTISGENYGSMVQWLTKEISSKN